MSATNVEDFVIARSFVASRELMFQVWTQPEHLQQWFSPKGFSVLAANMDFRANGSYHYGMRLENGTEVWGKWLIREIVVPERLIFINTFSDPAGGLTRHPFAPDWPQQMLSTISFTEENWKTTVTVRWAPYMATEVECKVFDAGRAGMTQGWGGTMEQLTNYLAEIQ